MELIVLSFAAATLLLLGHFTIVVRNWVAGQFTQD
jgi:hypothetical protein